jgi:hypothetical protein
MEQRRIAGDTFQNAFNLFNLLLFRERPGIPCSHDKISREEVVEELDYIFLNYSNVIYDSYYSLGTWVRLGFTLFFFWTAMYEFLGDFSEMGSHEEHRETQRSLDSSFFLPYSKYTQPTPTPCLAH